MERTNRISAVKPTDAYTCILKLVYQTAEGKENQELVFIGCSY